MLGSLLERLWLWGAKGRLDVPKSARPGSTGRGRGGVKIPPQREEGFWEEGYWGLGQFLFHFGSILGTFWGRFWDHLGSLEESCGGKASK